MSPKDGKNKSVRPEAGEPEELTVIVMRFRGSGETIRKGFDTVTQALNSLAPVPVLALPRQPRKLTVTTPAANGVVAPDEEGNGEYEEDEVLDAEEASPEEASPRKPRDRRPPKMPNLVNTLDYQSKISLADYVKEKKPKNATERYLVVAGWFKHHRATESISVDDMFTCFSVMDWKDRPEDMAQLFRSLKSKQRWFDSGSEKGTWKLTIKGLNQVDNKMGAANAE